MDFRNGELYILFMRAGTNVCTGKALLKDDLRDLHIWFSLSFLFSILCWRGLSPDWIGPAIQKKPIEMRGKCKICGKINTQVDSALTLSLSLSFGFILYLLFMCNRHRIVDRFFWPKRTLVVVVSVQMGNGELSSWCVNREMNRGNSACGFFFSFSFSHLSLFLLWALCVKNTIRAKKDVEVLPNIGKVIGWAATAHGEG